MRNIGLIGKARAGKDTAAAHLVREHAYTRLAFADPLKEMALRANPIVKERPGWVSRLVDVVSAYGWERAKDEYPEVRRVLQHMGQAQREMDEDYWLNILLRKVDGAAEWHMPVVVTDVRYRNEALALRERGFRLIRITRGVPAVLDASAAHASETELDDFAADVTLVNGGSLDALYAMIGAQV